MKRLIVILLCCVLAVAGCAQKPDNRHVTIETNFGNIVVELEPDKAPVTVQNFLRYVDEGFYNDTVFHRVIPQFMIQGGGFDTSLKKKQGHASIKNEADNGLLNKRGTIAMARTSDVDSATSEFFINHNDNTFLDHKVRDFGYAVFGRVIAGMEVVDAIATTKTMRRNYVFANLPEKQVLIKRIVRGK